MNRVLITGGTGFVGQELVQRLIARGDSVTVLSRDPARARKKLPAAARAVAWDPEHEGPWTGEVASATAVVHLAGENVAQRWTPEVRRAIDESRAGAGRRLVEAMARTGHKPEVFVSASAVGYYGPQPPERVLDEDSGSGEGFLADVCVRWEEAARGAEALGVRTVILRIGVVLGEGGGPLEKMLLPFKLFAGGPIGRGDQIVSWVHRDDVVGLVLFAIDNPEARGPINVVSPNPASSTELARAIGQVMHRPSWLKAPSFAVKLALGEAAEVVTEGQRALPRRALALGYRFHHPDLVPALRSILAPG